MALNIGNDWITLGAGKRAPNVNYSLSNVTTAGIGKISDTPPVFQFSDKPTLGNNGSRPVTRQLLSDASDVLGKIENRNSEPLNDTINAVKAMFGSKEAAKAIHSNTMRDATMLSDFFNKRGWNSEVASNGDLFITDDYGIKHKVENPGLLSRLWNAKGEITGSIVGSIAASKLVQVAIPMVSRRMMAAGAMGAAAGGAISTTGAGAVIGVPTAAVSAATFIGGALLGGAGAALGSIGDMTYDTTIKLDGENVMDPATFTETITRGLQAYSADIVAGASAVAAFAALRPVGKAIAKSEAIKPVLKKAGEINSNLDIFTKQGFKDGALSLGVSIGTGAIFGYPTGAVVGGLTRAGLMGFRAWDKAATKAELVASGKLNVESLEQVLKEQLQNNPELAEKASFLAEGLKEVKDAKGLTEKAKALHKVVNDNYTKSSISAMESLVSDVYKNPERRELVAKLADKVFAGSNMSSREKTLAMALLTDPNGMQVIKRVASNWIGTPANMKAMFELRDQHLYDRIADMGTLSDIPAIKAMADEGVERYQALVIESYKTLDEFSEASKYTTSMPSDFAKISNYDNYILARYAELVQAGDKYIASNMAGSEISNAANKLNNLSSHTAARFATGNAEQRKRLMDASGKVTLKASDLAKMRTDLTALPLDGLTKDTKFKIGTLIKDIDEELELKFSEAIRDSNGAFTSEHRQIAKELLNNANIATMQVEALKTNAIYKAFQDDLADTGDIANAIIKATNALDSTELDNFLKFIPKEEVKKVEGIIINAAMQKAILTDSDKQILNMVALNGLISKYNFKSIEAQNAKQIIELYSSIFRSDKDIIKYMTPNISASKTGVAQGLTANLWKKFRIMLANRTFAMLMQNFGRETTQKTYRVAKMAAKIIDNPSNAENITAFKDFVASIERGEIKDFTKDDFVLLKSMEASIDNMRGVIAKMDDIRAQTETEWKATMDAGIEKPLDDIIEEVVDKALAKEAQINEAITGIKEIPAPPKAQPKQDSEALKTLGRQIAKTISIDNQQLANPETIREMAHVGVRELQEQGIYVEPASVMDMAVSYYNRNKKGTDRLKMSKAERAKFMDPADIEEKFANAKEIQAQAKATKASQEAAEATTEPKVESQPDVISAAKPAPLVDEPVQAAPVEPKVEPTATEPLPKAPEITEPVEPKVEKPKKASTPKKGKVSPSTIKKADKVANDKYQQVKFILTGMDDMDLADPYTVAMEMTQALKKEGLDADTMYEVIKNISERVTKEEGIYIPVIDKAHFVNNIYGVDL